MLSKPLSKEVIFMAFKPTPKKFASKESFENVSQASHNQTGKRVTVRSTDPVNFPVFETPINQKVLVYVPNHRVTNAEGAEEMRMDKGAFHAVISGGQYMSLRCYSGIFNEDEGYDGSCPLCDTQNDIWELYRKEYASIAKAKGIDPDNDPEDLLKPVRQELTKNMVVKAPEVWYTFPIVVIECEEGTTNPKVGEDGKLKFQPMWYSIRESTYIDKWAKAFETMADSPTHPAGNWFVLNFTYTPKSGKHDKMGSARALQVGCKQMSADYIQWADYFNKLTEEWDAFKAQETVIANQYYDLEDVKKIADEAMKPVRQKLEIFELKEQGITGGTAVAPTNAQQALAGFGSVTEQSADGGAVPATPTEPTAPAQAGAPITPPQPVTTADPGNMGAE